MKLKIKNLNLYAGRPIVFLNKESAENLDVSVGERVSLSYNSRKIYAVVDIFTNLVAKDELGVSKEVESILHAKNHEQVEVSPAGISSGARLIKKKISGKELTEKEIDLLVKEIVHNELTEAEIAYFAAAEKMKGMSMKEIISMTKAMVNTGKRLNFHQKIVADKHSIGGIPGNRTTPIVVSICSALGLTMPKTSSRAITSASGTADVIETISRVDFPASELMRIVKKTNACLAWGGALGLAPSDDKIIQVERILNLDIEPQLLASIMSKKISAGATHVLIDIPYGKAGKMETLSKAKSLGNKFQQLAKHFKLKLKCVYTKGDEPIGNGFGPVLEMLDILKVLRNEPVKDLRKKSLFLAEQLLDLCGIKNAKQKALETLNSGKAFQQFQKIINAQNGKDNFYQQLGKLKLAKFRNIIKASSSGNIKEINNKKINNLCRILGTPESQGSGIYLYKHVGEKTKQGESLMIFYSESKDKMQDALHYLKESQAIVIS